MSGDPFEELEAEIEGRPGAATGGIPDLFSPALTPPAQFMHRLPGSEADFLGHLARWIVLPLRPNQDVSFTRRLFDALLRLIDQRGTLPGLDAMLRAWLRGDLLPSSALLMVTDLTRAFPDVDAVFQLGRTATLGVDTVLGEGPPFFFIVDLVTDPAVDDLRAPAGLDRFQPAVRALIEAERPAHTYDQRRVRAQTMQLAPTGQTTIDGVPRHRRSVRGATRYLGTRFRLGEVGRDDVSPGAGRAESGQVVATSTRAGLPFGQGRRTAAAPTRWDGSGAAVGVTLHRSTTPLLGDVRAVSAGLRYE